MNITLLMDARYERTHIFVADIFTVIAGPKMAAAANCELCAKGVALTAILIERLRRQQTGPD
jgi:hypothetical protein